MPVYTITVTIDHKEHDNPYQAAKCACNRIKEDGYNMIYEVIDVDTLEEFDVDLGLEESEAVTKNTL